MKDAMRKLLYADDLTLVASGKQELQETLEEWNGLKITPREDGSYAHRPPEGRAGHRAGGEETDSGDSLVYLGGAVSGDGKTQREVRRRAQSGANA